MREIEEINKEIEYQKEQLYILGLNPSPSESNKKNMIKIKAFIEALEWVIEK